MKLADIILFHHRAGEMQGSVPQIASFQYYCFAFPFSKKYHIVSLAHGGLFNLKGVGGGGEVKKMQKLGREKMEKNARETGNQLKEKEG